MSGSSALFSDLLASITERGRNLMARRGTAEQSASATDLAERCEMLLSRQGEASGTAIAAEIIAGYEALDVPGREQFFTTLLEQFGPDRASLTRLAETWLREPTDTVAGDLHFVSEPRRQELLRRLNRAPGATRSLVAMRADLIAILKKVPDLAPVDRDLAHLLASWFNRGFLVLQRIDWSTPAIVLEKIIRYEAVHEIPDFPALRLRIDPPDRRCYGFFHPALPDEPLIFVEVALTNEMPGAIAPLLDPQRDPVVPEQAKVAVFYSISNCQKGLAGISFGSFLIKQVVEDLRREFPRIQTFVTLSPLPGFMRWLGGADLASVGTADRQAIDRLQTPGWHLEPENATRLRGPIEQLAAAYLLHAKRSGNRPIDPVAGFHVGNGARVERLNWIGDVSSKGLQEAAGLMVNYLYDLEEIEKNHEAFVNSGEIAAAPAVRRLVNSESKLRAVRSEEES